MVTINFFGEGVRYWLCEIPLAEFDIFLKEKEKTGQDWEHLFFDLSFLDELGYANWESIHLLKKGKGWLIAERNRMELSVGRKKRVVELDEFLGDKMLFQTFSKKVLAFEIDKKEAYQYVLLVQLDTGKINKYELNKDMIDLDKFLFRFYDGRGGRIGSIMVNKG
jgi:hypothetical protein